MKTDKQVVTIVTYRSEVLLHPEISTTSEELGRVIEFADKTDIWKIVTGYKSKAFGVKSCEYIGWAQGSNAPGAILERARHLCAAARPDLHNDGRGNGGPSIFHWKGAFTLAHSMDKGFTGGFFQQHDGSFDRNCMTLDYTPATLPQVLRNFMEWAGGTMANRWKLDKEWIDLKIVDQALALRPDFGERK
jgi:hypothetical protein